MKMHKTLLLALACTWSMAASAQWQWIDKDGRKVFSDRPPPADIAEKNILRQPGGMRAPRAEPVTPTSEAAAPPAAGQAAAVAGTTPAAPTTDKELEEKKAQADAAEAAKKKAAEEKLAKAKADNCERARASRAVLDSGRPMAQTNAKGERTFLDAAARTAEGKRIDAIVSSDCAR